MLTYLKLATEIKTHVFEWDLRVSSGDRTGKTAVLSHRTHTVVEKCSLLSYLADEYEYIRFYPQGMRETQLPKRYVIFGIHSTYPEIGYPDRLGPSGKYFLTVIIQHLFMA